MKAIIYTKYGPPDVLQLKEVEKPTPKHNEILIKIHATTVTTGDCELRSLNFSSSMLKTLMRLGIGFRGPRKKFSILGQELAGEVESIGEEVTLFKEGDQVFACTEFHFGAYAEYKCLREDRTVVLKPTNMTYEEAAAVPIGGLEAVHYIKQANVQSGQTVLIIGAGGSIGTIAVQYLKTFDVEITCVDSRKKLDMLSSIGADHVIDYTQEDFTKNCETYDVIFDIVGKNTFSECINSLNKNGIYLAANSGISLKNREKKVAKKSDRTLIAGNMDSEKERTKDLIHLKELIESGKIRIVIDRKYSLEELPEAHKYVETGQKMGNVIITVK